MPTIRLVTDDDMRQISSQNLDAIPQLPHLYRPTDDGDVMRSWGIAFDRTLPDYVRMFPDALVAPKSLGQFVERGELLYYGAEAAAGFVVNAS